MMTHNRFTFLFLVAASTLFTACGGSGSGIPQGKVVGSADLKKSSGTEVYSLEGNIQSQNSKASYQILIQAKSLLGGVDQTWKFDLRRNSNREISLSANQFWSGERILKADGPCFVHGTADQTDARVCFDGKEISLFAQAGEFSSIDISLEPFDASRVPHLETPRRYSIPELRDLAKKQSFDGRIQYEQVQFARASAQSAYTALLPHFSFNTLFAAAQGQTITILKNLSDLVPFLFPSRWLKADIARLESKATLASYEIMQLDAGLFAEGLALGLVRDSKAISILEDEKARIATFRDILLGREKLGLIPPGSSDDLTTLVDQLTQSLIAYRQTTRDALASLAYSAGLVNPEAVMGIDDSTTANFGLTAEFDPHQAQSLALQRSLELGQLKITLNEAKEKGTQRYFQWLDPAGDSGGAIGVGMFPYIAAGDAQIHQIEIQYEKLQAVVLQKALSTYQSLGTTQNQHEISLSDLEIQKRRVDRLEGQLKLGLSVSVLELSQAYQALMKSQVEVIISEYSWMSTWARFERLLRLNQYQ